MKIKENLDVIVEKYPYADSLNKKLMVEVGEIAAKTNKNHNYYTNIVGTKFGISDDGPSKLISNWVVNIIKNKMYNSNSEPIVYDDGMWFAIYDEGDYARSHHHIPYALFSWVYFVNCPRGSSPLVFTSTNKRIKAEEGKLILFPSCMKHHVPKNKCKDRITLVGNTLPLRGSL
tara:strand:+ start:75 stop:596 length:522 start_codon:yes stop_codon:yes gene_type:complete